MNIIEADLSHVSDIAPLFNSYRIFYECESNIKLATTYIEDRITNNESDIFIAVEEKTAVGFVQLYPSFCSVDAVKIYILYDLFVDSGSRKSGVGEALMNRATKFAKTNGAARLDLSTAKTNHPGQRLYERLGYKKTLEDFFAYSLSVE